MPEVTQDVQRQELSCHECGGYVQFDLDLKMNGKHVLKCPKCGHEHCRVVKDGVITSERWDTRNPPPPPKVCDCGAPPGTEHKDTCPCYVKPYVPSAPTTLTVHNMPVYLISAANTVWTRQSTFATYQGVVGQGTGGNIYLYQAWMNSTTGTAHAS
jgi:hypothetical protein